MLLTNSSTQDLSSSKTFPLLWKVLRSVVAEWEMLEESTCPEVEEPMLLTNSSTQDLSSSKTFPLSWKILRSVLAEWEMLEESNRNDGAAASKGGEVNGDRSGDRMAVDRDDEGSPTSASDANVPKRPPASLPVFFFFLGVSLLDGKTRTLAGLFWGGVQLSKSRFPIQSTASSSIHSSSPSLPRMVDELMLSMKSSTQDFTSS